VIIPTVATTAGMVLFAVSAGIKALYRRPVTGATSMVGQLGVVKAALNPEGQVLVNGERWRAVSQDGPAAIGETVQVADIEGLTLKVTKTARRA